MARSSAGSLSAAGGSDLLGDFVGIMGADHVRPASAEDAIDGIQPRCVVEPGSVTEASAALQLAHKENLAIAPRGSGSKLGLGNLPARLDLILSTRRLNRVVEHASGDLVARLEAGAPLATAQEVFQQAGQWLPIDPPEPNATIGGIIAANASGPHRLRYGTMRDLLIGMTYILPDGTTAKSGGKVVKNVAGYDFGKLFTGSLGTLAVLVEVIVRLHPIPAASRTVVLGWKSDDVSAYGAAVQTILHSTLVPSAIEGFFGENASLCVLFEGVEPGVIAQSERATELLREYGEVSIVSSERHSGRPLPEDSRTPDSEWTRLKISAGPGLLAVVLSDIQAAARRRSTVWDVRGHAGSGIVYVSMQDDTERQIDTIGALRERIVRRGGALVVEQAPLEVKQAIDVWGASGDALNLMRRVKERFDPQNILNPGRFIGGI